MSSLSNYINEFSKSTREYLGEMRKKKADGEKVICYYGSKVPVEILDASGSITYALYDGGDALPTEVALKYLLSFINVQSRYQVGQHDLGLNPVTPIADLIIIDCKEADSERVGSAFEFMGLPIWKLGVPQDWEKEIAFKYYVGQLGHLKNKLEEISRKTITQEKLKQSIIKYNNLRELLMLIREMRKGIEFPVSAEQFLKLNHNVLRMNPDISISYLSKIYNCLLEEQTKSDENRKRIMVVGRTLAFGDYSLVQILDEFGTLLVTEVLDEAVLHSGKIETDGDLIHNIAKFYFNDILPPCVFTPSWQVRWNRIKSLINEYAVDGIIYYLLSFDVIYDFENSLFSKKASEVGIPYLTLESSYNFSRESTESLKNRVENFLQVCSNRR